ncbi:MAG: nucleotidyltransferase domain-containing protein [Thiomargarita sp.]|nr:nucleotidyltransferase domain-containing protein [Thiomargarita sp.]
MNLQQIAETNKILEITIGSHLYGTNTAISDQDYSGVFLPTKEFIFGFQQVREVNFSTIDKTPAGKNTQNAIDYKLYEFRKFVQLALDNNPNILEHLFVNDDNIIYINEIGKLLLSKRRQFLHKGLIKKFKGYALSQKHKMVIRSNNYYELENAYQYLKDYTEQKKLLIELQEKKLPFLKYNKDYCIIGDLNLQKGIFVKKAVNMLAERLSKVGNRKNLVTKYGYDTKFGSHLIRLLLQCKELLSTSNLVFPLAYRERILEIKQGNWTIKELLDYAEELENEIDKLAATTDLPNKSNFDEIEQLTISIMENHLCHQH